MASFSSQSWSQVELEEPILKAIQSLGFSAMTPVQAACIPLFLAQKDVAVEAVTGSGKTLAFLVPVLQILLTRTPPKNDYDIKALILSPTRELATQIEEVLLHFLKEIPSLRHFLVIGGEKLSKDIAAFKKNGAHIVIATPGRLMGLLEKKNENIAGYFRHLEILILDEADRLLDMGFEAALSTIFTYLPKQRRTGLFSATQTKELEDLIRAGLRNPVSIVVKDKSTQSGLSLRTPSTLNNFYLIVEADKKFSTLVNFLRMRKSEKHIVFFSTCSSVVYFSTLLQHLLKKVNFICIHGKMQKKRKRAFETFRKLNNGVLICTDVMARGVDFPDINWVIQFDPPSNSSFFVHRCGRTARCGNAGSALILLLPNEETYLTFLEMNQKVKLVPFDTTGFEIMDLVPKMRKLALQDRNFYEKSIHAFVSFIRFYTKHECHHIFRFKDLNFAKLALGFGLLRLPSMPELRSIKVEGFEKVAIDFDQIKFKDKLKEEKRQEKIKHKINESQEKIKIIKNKNKITKERPIKKKRKKRKNEISVEEFEELAHDALLIKKHKKKKISDDEFDRQFSLD